VYPHSFKGIKLHHLIQIIKSKVVLQKNDHVHIDPMYRYVFNMNSDSLSVI